MGKLINKELNIMRIQKENFMKNRFLILTLGIFCLTLFALPAAAQKGLNGTWSWEGKPDRKKWRDTVWIDIKQTGNTVKGGISISAYNPDEEDGSDSPITPFIGTVNGNIITIEFDANDTSPIDGSPMPKYVRRRGGAPNTATLKLVGGKLEFTQTKGSIGKSYPRTFVLTKNR
jgi:hypothetical protein